MDDPQVVRAGAHRRPVDEWGLTLAAVGIDSRIDWSPQHGYLLLVAAPDAARAQATLDAYDDENRPTPARAPMPEYGAGSAAAVLTALLCLVFVVSGPRADGHALFAVGAADAARIQTGEWWRAVTALTLHADFPHILSNAVVLLIFGSTLCTLVGPGVGLWLLLLAGAGGNLINTALRGAPHSAIGASTAIFGALGALAALRVVQRRRGARLSAFAAWAPLAAALALLGMLGSSARSDVLAHLFGFLVGALLGGVVATVWPQPLERAAQRGLVVGAAVAVAACWGLALLR
jgi:membrane associated rhomboid family serine protease